MLVHSCHSFVFLLLAKIRAVGNKRKKKLMVYAKSRAAHEIQGGQLVVTTLSRMGSSIAQTGFGEQVGEHSIVVAWVSSTQRNIF